MNAPPTNDPSSVEHGAGYRPFVGLNDYFYNIRMRTNKLLTRAELVDLLKPAAGRGIRIIDCVFEAHDPCVHYLAELKAALAGEVDSISRFRHSDPRFEG